MAKNTPEGLVGMLGTIVFYTMNGKSYARTKPARRKRKRGEKPNPHLAIFGKVSKHGSAITGQLSKHVKFKFGLPPYNRMRKWIFEGYSVNHSLPLWELSAQHSGMCQLSNDTDMRDYFRANLTVSDNSNGIVLVEIPPFNPVQKIKAPKQAKNITVRLIAVSSCFDKGVVISGVAAESHTFPYNNEVITFPVMELKTKGATGDIAVVALAIEYETATQVITENKWLPAAALAIGRLK